MGAAIQALFDVPKLLGHNPVNVCWVALGVFSVINTVLRIIPLVGDLLAALLLLLRYGIVAVPLACILTRTYHVAYFNRRQAKRA